MTTTKHCDLCQFFDFGEAMECDPFAWIRKPSCSKGHNPKFFTPKGPMDPDWGYKRKCNDYQQGDHVIEVKLPSHY